MKANAKRRCKTCDYFWRNDEDMLPEEDLPRIPGTCNNAKIPAYQNLRWQEHGRNCTGWKISRVREKA